MTIKNVIAELISSSGGDTVTVLEVPPGTGKTKNGIDVSVEMAGKGSNILFFLPTHASALTAFAYAVNAFYSLYKSTSNPKKLPFIVYYEGVNRYCPLYIYRSLFNRALDYARRRWWINRDEYERLRSLGPEETMRVFGWSIVCRKVCPIFKSDVNVGRARIFVPRSFSELSDQVLSGEAKMYVRDAVNALAEMSRNGLVRYLGVYMDFDNGVFRGICVRVLLNKAVVKGMRRKVQIFFKGSVIIAPTSGVEFLLKSVVKKLDTMSRSGAGVSKPVVILDEYDTYFYRPSVIPIFTIRWLEFERNLARKTVETFKSNYVNGVPFDVEEATAALLAFIILEQVISMAKSYVENRRIDMLSSSVSLVFDAIAEEIVDDAFNVIQPLRPRELAVMSPERFTDYMVRVLEDYVVRNGITFINPRDVKRDGIWYYLQLWEWMLIDYCRRHNIPYLVPALYSFTGAEFATAYLERNDRHISAAKWVFLVRKKGAPHPKTGLVKYVVAYRAYQSYGTVIIPEKTRETKSKLPVWVIYMISYDCKFYTLFGQDLKVFLTSATGIPWASDFFKSRSGLVSPFDAYGSCLIGYLERYKYPKAVYKKDRTEYVMVPMEPDPLKKKFVIVTSHFHFILKYAVHGRVSPEVLPHLPSRAEVEEDPFKLEQVLSNYSYNLSWLFSYVVRDLRKMPQDQNLNAALMVLCQRKDIAVRMALEAISIGRYFRFTPKLQVCTETKCVDPPSFKRNYVEEMLKFMKEIKASHLLVRMKKHEFKNEVKVYVTWFRSKLCRGVDLPDDDILLYTLVVGSPYRPPSTIDFVAWDDKPLDALEVYGKAGRVEIQFTLRNSLTGTTSTIPLCIANQPVDISESINELTQAYGRALRKAWSARQRGIKYVTQLIIPYWLNNKFYGYSPLWMQEIFYIDVRLTIEKAIREGEKLMKLKEQQRQQAQQQAQNASQQQQTQQAQQQQEVPQTTVSTQQQQSS